MRFHKRAVIANLMVCSMTSKIASSLVSKSSLLRRSMPALYAQCNALSTQARQKQTLPESQRFVNNALYRIRQVNDMPNDIRSGLLEFKLGNDELALGLVSRANAEMLCNVDNSAFRVIKNDYKSYLTLQESSTQSYDARTKAVSLVMNELRKKDIVTGWRNEDYPITHSFYNDPPLFVMERAAVPLLGAIEYGVHINGLVRDEETNEIKMWMARRSADKSKYPGMLDHLVAGGQPYGISLMDNVVKECQEEAGIPPEVTRAGIVPAGAITYATYSSSSKTVSRAVLFCFDLYLPQDFVPTPVDGEVQDFFLWTVPQILESLDPDYHDPIKPNCYNCIIDWLMRTGNLVSPDTPGYLTVLRELRSADCR